MIDREAGYSTEKSGSSLVALPPTDPVFGFKSPDAPATRAREQASDALDRSWIASETRAGRFDAFRTLPEEAKTAWLGHAVARTLEASLNLPGGRVCAFHDHLGRLLGIDVAKWWRPTGANYFDRVPKSVTLAALEEVGGSVFAEGHAKSKKAELSETAERIFAGSGVPADVKERALAWVPDPLRFTAAAVASAEETPPWEDDPRAEPAGISTELGASHPPELGEAPAAGAFAELDPPSTAAGSERGGRVEDAPSTEQEEMKQAA
jgi:ParB family chromosome partitioning protein